MRWGGRGRGMTAVWDAASTPSVAASPRRGGAAPWPRLALTSTRHHSPPATIWGEEGKNGRKGAGEGGIKQEGKVTFSPPYSPSGWDKAERAEGSQGHERFLSFIQQPLFPVKM